MILNLRKRILFFVGIFLTGALGLLSSYMRTNYSKGNSLIVPTAKADTPPCITSCGIECTSGYSLAQNEVYFCCFPAKTCISTPLGDKEIQNLVIGEVVYGFDTETGVKGEYPVTRTLKHDKNNNDGGVYSPLIKISYDGGSLTVTDNHWIYRKNGRVGDYAHFDRAGMFQVGDILTLENGEEVAITEIEKGPEYDSVYNLEVKNVHTYFAGGVRVHNSDGPGGCCGCAGGVSGK